MRHLRPVCLLPAVLCLVACPDLDLGTEAPGAVIDCASANDCPAGQICGTASGLCFVPGVDDVLPVATLVSVEPATLFPGAGARVVVDVSEVLAVPPRLVLAGADGTDVDAVLVEGDHRLGNTRFTFTFTVAAEEARASLGARALLVDLANNAADVSLPAFTVDVAGPALGVGAIVAALDKAKSHARDGDTVSVVVDLGEADAAVSSAILVQGGAQRATFSIRDGVIQPLTLQGLAEGDLVVDVEAKDAVGNVASGTSNAIPVDLVPPALRLEDLRLGGAPIVDRLVTDRTVALSLRPGAAGGDVLTWCVEGDVVAADGCDDDDAFQPAADGIIVELALTRGLAGLRIVGRDRAFHEGVVELTLALLQTGDPSATVSLAPPTGQTALKVGDAITVTGTTVPGAQVAAVIVDSEGRQLGVGVARTTADDSGAFATTVLVPPGSPDGQPLFVRVVPELIDGDGGRVALTPTTSAGLPVDLSPPTVDLAVAGGLVQPDDSVSIAWTIGGAVAATVTGDIDDSEDVSPLDAAAIVTGVVAVDLVDGDGSREVTVTVRDGAGNVDVAVVTILVNSELPVVQLLARNEEKPTVLGVRPGSRLLFSGSATDNVIVEQRLSFFDADGSERVACRQPIAFTLSGRIEGGFSIGTVTAVSVRTCAGASDARAVLVVQNAAGLRSVLEQSLSAIDIDDNGAADVEGAFYFDDTPPVLAAPVVAFDATAPPGRDAILEQRDEGPVLVTPSPNITVAVNASDEHPLKATVSGTVKVGATFDLPAGPRAFVIDGGDGDKSITVTVEDEVGHRVDATPTTFVLDTQRPGQAQVTATIYREVEADGDALADDLLSSFFVGGNLNAVEANSRVFVFAAGDDPATAVPLASGNAEVNGAFNGIDVTALDAPVIDLDVVVVDKAGNRAPPARITRPRFTLTQADNAIGVRPAVVGVTLTGDLQGGAQLAVENLDGSPVSVGIGDVVLQPTGATTFTGTLALDADDGLVAGAGTARALVSGRGPNLDPASVSVDAVVVDVDFQRPTVEVAALQIAEVALGTDTITGLAGAVRDLAGPDARAVEGFVVRVGTEAATVRADGSFGPVSLGDDAGNSIDVVVDRDDADNPGVVTRLLAPVVTGIAATPARVRVGDVVTVTFDVSDEQVLDDPIVKLLDLDLNLVSRSTIGALTSFVYAGTILATTTGDKPVVVAAGDASGHIGDGSRAGIVFVDADAPVITLENPLGPATPTRILSAAIADVSSTTTSVSVRDQVGNFFDGTAFTSPTELLLPDGDGAPGRFALLVSPLVDGDDYVLRIVSEDVVGNRAERSASFTFDVTPPILQFPAPPVDVDSLEVDFEATIDDPAATLFAIVDGATRVAVPRDGPVRVPFAVPTPALDGLIPRPIRFFAVDVAGNASAEFVFNVTTTPKLQLAGGDGTLCAVRASDKALICWGDNRDMHLGQPDIDTDTLPVSFVSGEGAPPGFIGPTRIWNLFTWRKVAVGGDVVCGIIDDGGTLEGPVRCVGSHRKGLMPLAPPDPGGGPFPPPPAPVVTPEIVTDLPNAFDIAMTSSRGCALVRTGGAGGELRCWGEPLGFGTRLANRFDVLPVGAAVAVGVGDNHACFLAGGRREVTCVGRNTHGQLGAAVPLGGQVNFPAGAALSSPDDDYDELLVSGDRTCARRRISREIDCVGDNARGGIALGRLNLQNPGGGGGEPGAIDAARFQTTVSDLPPVLASAGASTRQCGIGTDGRLLCLGTAAAAARGDGVSDTQARAVGRFGDATDTWDLVATLGDTTCALRSLDDSLRCAGESGHGEIVLAAPTTPAIAEPPAPPVLLMTPRLLSLPGAIDTVSVGDRTVCATVNDGLERALFCSGDTTDNRIVAGPVGGSTPCNDDTPCGLGQCVFGVCRTVDTLDHPDTAVRVGALNGAHDVGGRFGCASEGDSVFCAGPPGNFLGRGDAPPTFNAGFPVADFVRVDGPPPGPTLRFFAERVAVGDTAACAFSGVSGPTSMFCWGDDLLDGNSTVAIPVPLSGVRDVVLGRSHGCVQLGGLNEFRCFGEDTDGVRGDGSGSGDLTPVVTDDPSPVVLRALPGPPTGGATLATHDDTACAIDDTNTVRCWGSNRHGVVDPLLGAIAFDQAHRAHNQLGNQFVAVGDDFACSVAGIELRCWGRPLGGLALEDAPGSVTVRTVSVDGSFTWLSLEAGDGFVCGRTNNGVACVGANTAGAFGDGQGLVETPTEVVLP